MASIPRIGASATPAASAAVVSRAGVIALTLIVVVIVGVADYATGHEILFSTFYLVPVAMAAWLVGRGFALVVSALSVGAWLFGDIATGAVFPRAFVPVWNSAIILAFYVVVVLLIDRLRVMQRELEERVRSRTVALTEEIAERERLEREILEIGERERRRIGRDLHDSLGQMLTGTALAGQVLQEKLAGRLPAESADAARLVGLVESAIEMTRRLSRGLDPVEIEGGGLAQGLRELAARTNGLSGVRCTCRSGAEVIVHDPVTALHLYRVAQEAITNAMKHGGATAIELRLETPGERVRLVIQDDGVGIPEPARRVPGMGLRVMAHRVTVMRGTFAIESVFPHGTRIVCEAPNS